MRVEQAVGHARDQERVEGQMTAPTGAKMPITGAKMAANDPTGAGGDGGGGDGCYAVATDP